jgi:Sec-independent protein translocase protein TatA
MSIEKKSNVPEMISGLLLAEVILPELLACKKLPEELRALADVIKQMRKYVNDVYAGNDGAALQKRVEVLRSVADTGMEKLELHDKSLPPKIRERIRTVRHVIRVLGSYFMVRAPQGAADGQLSEADKQQAVKPDAPKIMDFAVEAKHAFKRTIQGIVSRYGDKFDFNKIKSMRDVPEDIKEELRFLPFADLSKSGRKGMEELMDNQLIRQMAAVALNQELPQINYEKASSFYAFVTPSFRNKKNSRWERFQGKTAF